MTGPDRGCTHGDVISDQGERPTTLDPASHATKADAAYASLREAILDGRLGPGEKVTLAGLASELGMSAMPVREALKRLAREGLVILTPHTDTLVAPFEVQDVQRIFVVRANLEALAARIAAARVTADLLGTLWTLHGQMQSAMAAEDYETFARCNRTFHDAIFDAADNPYLRRILDEVWTLSYRFRAGYRIIPGRAAAACEEHEVIVKALSSGQEAAAESAMHTHVSNAGVELVELIQGARLPWPSSRETG